jgi:hypothetical protein
MFLIRIAGRSRRDDRGSALVAVIGVMVIGLILTTVAMSSVVHGLGFTTSTRAGVQSQAAAEAGIASARAGLYPDPVSHLNTCASQPTPGWYVSTSDPKYTAVVEHYDTGPSWIPGCPGPSTTQVRVTSTGNAQARGVAGQAAGDSSRVEGVFAWVRPTIEPSGPGIYVYKGGEIESNSGLDLTEGTEGGLVVPSGDLTCSNNNTVINGDVVVHGNLIFGGSCRVNGNAAVTGSATLDTGFVALDLTAASVSPINWDPHVGGNYYPGGPVPEAPPWTEVGYVPADWVDVLTGPFAQRPLTGSECSFTTGNIGGVAGDPAKPVILNALGCVPNAAIAPSATNSGVRSGNNTTVSLTSDVVIFANRFNFDFNAVRFVSSSSALHRLWFITPDNSADSAPTCPIPAVAPHFQGDFTVGNNFEIGTNISALLYTPCAFNGVNGFKWRGQIYSGNYSRLKNNPSFTFVPMGAGGVNFETGTPTPPGTHYPHLGAVTSIRDLSIP